MFILEVNLSPYIDYVKAKLLFAPLNLRVQDCALVTTMDRMWK